MLDRDRDGSWSLELLVRSGLVARLLAGVALRGDGLGCWCMVMAGVEAKAYWL